MALNINTNIAALKARQQLNKNSGLLQKSLERLSTGLRLNWAADDAAGLAIADGLRATAKGLAQAIRNANEGISLIKVADGALIEYGNILATIKEKVTQAANATQTAETRKALQRDIQKLLQELDNIARTTEFNGQKILSGSFVNKKFQIGSASYVTASLSIRSAETGAVGGTKTAVLDLNTIGPVQLTLTNAQSGLSVTTEKIELYYNNNSENGAGALANEINRYTGITGVSAVAVVEVTSEQIQSGTITGLKINGVTIGDVTVQAADADGALASAINSKSLETGVTATVTEDGRLVLTSTDGRAIKVEADGGLNSVLGKNAEQLSTLGHIRLIQKGVADFQITGTGGTGVGATFTIKSTDTVTLDGESTLKGGSVIAAGSKLTEGTVIGGDATLYSSMKADSAIGLKADSQVHWGSTLAKGTIITGDIVVGGYYKDASNNDRVALEQDMVAKAGSVLKAGTVVGKGTVVYGSLAQALGVAEGSTLAGSATLAADVTLDTDILLKYDPAANTQIAASSTIAAGSKLGTDFLVGITWGGAGTRVIAASSFTGGGVLQINELNSSATAQTVGFRSAGTTNNTVTLADGSLLKEGTRFTFEDNGNNAGTAVIAVGSGVVLEGTLYDASTGQTTQVTIDAANSLTLEDGDYFELSKDTYLPADVTLTVNGDDAYLKADFVDGTYLADGWNAGSNIFVDGTVAVYDASTTSTLSSGTAASDNFGAANLPIHLYSSSGTAQTFSLTGATSTTSDKVIFGEGTLFKAGSYVQLAAGDNTDTVVFSMVDGTISGHIEDSNGNLVSTITEQSSVTLGKGQKFVFDEDTVLDGELQVRVNETGSTRSQVNFSLVNDSVIRKFYTTSTFTASGTLSYYTGDIGYTATSTTNGDISANISGTIIIKDVNEGGGETVPLQRADYSVTNNTGSITFGAGSVLVDEFKIQADGTTFDTANSSIVISVASGTVSGYFVDSTGSTTTPVTITSTSSVTLDGKNEAFIVKDIQELSGNMTITFSDTNTTAGSVMHVYYPDYMKIAGYTVGGTFDSATLSGEDAAAAAELDYFTETESAAGYSAASASTTNSTFKTETELARDSVLVNNSQLSEGSRFGGDAYVGQVTTTQTTTLAQGSILAGGTQATQGSVLDTDDFIISADTTLNADMTLATGTVLKSGTKLAAGTTVQQDMTLYTAASGGTAVNVSAGTTLDQDLYLQSDVTLTADMVLAAGSTIAQDSELVLAPTGDLGQVETEFLSSLNVLTYEDAQLALTIVEAAITDIDAIRAELGSVQVQLESTVANISVTYTNTKAAEAAIREVDFAEEVANFTKMQVLMQAGSFSLAQANTIPQLAIQLLQG